MVNTTTPLITDVLIVGAGPSGLFAAFECGMLKLRCHLVDVLDAVGGQCRALYPEKPIYDIPAHPSILADDLIQRLEEQLAPFHPTYHLGRRMVGLDRQDDGSWRGSLEDGTIIEAKAVILAAGAGAFGPNRPPLEGIESFEGQGNGQGVAYFVARREDYRDKTVVIAGGGDSAVDWAISLSEIAKRVQVVHRRPKFRAAPESEARLQALAEAGKVDLVTPYQLHSLEGDKGVLKAVIVATLDGETRRLDADSLLPFFGLATDLGVIAQWGLTLDGQQIPVDPASMATSLPGVFAVGDVSTYPGKLKLILSGFAEAARAAHSAHAAVHPDEALHFVHSTSLGKPA